MKKELMIEGMMCQNCVKHVTHALEGILGAADVQVSLEDKKATVNVPESVTGYRFQPVSRAEEPVLLQISGERNSLERCMLHFASYEKHTEYDEENGCWLCSIYYDSADETELLIDVLSFGPVVKVLGPESFLAQVKERVKRQHELLYRMEL